MKKLTLEGFFHPGKHDNEEHRFSRPMRTQGRNDFPYSFGPEEVMDDEEIDEELELEESISLKEFYGIGKRMPGTDAMSYGRTQNSAGGHTGGKSSKGWQGAGKTPNHSEEDPVEEDENRAMPADWMNYDEEEDYEVFDDFYGLSEVMIGTRERATKEMGPASTKQPWKDGAPRDPLNLTTEDDVDEEEELEELQRDVGLSLEAALKEYSSVLNVSADTSYSHAAGTKKQRGEYEDLEFFDKMEDSNPFLINTEEEFKEEERKRLNNGEAEEEK